MSAMALGIGLDDENYFRPAHTGHNNQLRLLHYPPVPAQILETQKATRLDAHSDWPSITLLFQDDCGGLQVEDPNNKGTFIDAPPLKDAIVMNVGDLMMRWSNGKGAPMRVCDCETRLNSDQISSNPRSIAWGFPQNRIASLATSV